MPNYIDLGYSNLLSKPRETAFLDEGITNANVDSVIYSGAIGFSQTDLSVLNNRSITLSVINGRGDSKIQAGKTDFTNTESGFILGIDDSDSDKPKFYIGNSFYYFNWTGTGINLKAEHSNLVLYDYVVDAAGYGDYTSLKSAIDAATAASATDVTIFVRKGTYTETGNIAFTGNVTIVGEDKKETIVNCTSAVNDEYLYVEGQLEVRDITITKNSEAHWVLRASGDYSKIVNTKLTNSTATGLCLRLNGDYVQVLNCEITNSQTGISLADSYASLVQGNYVDTKSGENSIGISVSGECKGTIIDNNEIVLKHTSGTTSSKGIYTTSAQLIISKNHIRNSVGEHSTGIYSDLSDINEIKVINNYLYSLHHGVYVAGSKSRVMISGNHVNGMAGHAIHMTTTGGAGYGYHIISNNIVEDSVRAIYIDGKFDYSQMIGNTIYNSASGVGILVFRHDINYSNISNNIIHDGGTGISVEDDHDVDNSRICDNIFYNCSSNSIYLTDRFLNSIMSNNKIVGGGGHGIYIIGSAGGSTFVGNNIDGCVADGIKAVYVHNTGCVFNSNVCVSNGSTGLELDTRSSTIVGNVVRSNTSAQITDADGTGSVNANNVVA